MIIKTTNSEDTLPVGLYEYTDDSSSTQYINNLKGDQKIKDYSGKKLTRLAELLLKNGDDYISLDTGAAWDPSSYKDIKSDEILSTTTYSYDTECVLRDNSNYDCKVYKAKTDDTNSTIIKSLESKQLYVYRRIYFNSASEVTFSKVNLSSCSMVINNNTLDIAFADDDTVTVTDTTTTTTTTDTDTDTFKISSENDIVTISSKLKDSSIEVTVEYDVFAIIDFTDRNTIEYLLDNPYDKNATTSESAGYKWKLLNKLEESSTTKSIIKLVNKTN